MNPNQKPIPEQDDFSDIWDLAKGYSPKESVDNDRAWEQFQRKINQDTTPQKAPTLQIVYRRILSYAAVIAMFALAGYLYFLPEKSIPLAEVTEQTAAKQIRLIELPDGSSVTLAANSSLTYSFTETQRKIQLSGHARFEVTRNEQAPFTVSSENTTVTVLGTGFDVDAYPNSDIKIFVNHGKVKVENPTEEVILTKNQGVISNKRGLNSWNLQQNPVDFKQDRILFENAPLNIVLETIKHNQGIQLHAPAQAMETATFTGSLPYTLTDSEIATLLSTALQLEIKPIN